MALSMFPEHSEQPQVTGFLDELSFVEHPTVPPKDFSKALQPISTAGRYSIYMHLQADAILITNTRPSRKA